MQDCPTKLYSDRTIFKVKFSTLTFLKKYSDFKVLEKTLEIYVLSSIPTLKMD